MYGLCSEIFRSSAQSCRWCSVNAGRSPERTNETITIKTIVKPTRDAVCFILKLRGSSILLFENRSIDDWPGKTEQHVGHFGRHLEVEFVRHRTDWNDDGEIGWPFPCPKFHREERPSMTRVTRQSWTPEQIQLLFSMIDNGVSAVRASVVLKRPKLAVQHKARQLGKSFPDARAVKTARLMKEAAEREALDRHRGF